MSYTVLHVDHKGFLTPVTFMLDGREVESPKCKISTGCETSMFHYSSIFDNPQLKDWWLEKCIKEGYESKDWCELYGVGGYKELFYKVPISDMKIDGVEVDIDYAWINFDKDGNDIVGMDILSKLFMIHIGAAEHSVKELGIKRKECLMVFANDRSDEKLNRFCKKVFDNSATNLFYNLL